MLIFRQWVVLEIYPWSFHLSPMLAWLLSSRMSCCNVLLRVGCFLISTIVGVAITLLVSKKMIKARHCWSASHLRIIGLAIDLLGLVVVLIVWLPTSVKDPFCLRYNPLLLILNKYILKITCFHHTTVIILILLCCQLLFFALPLNAVWYIVIFLLFHSFRTVHQTIAHVFAF